MIVIGQKTSIGTVDEIGNRTTVKQSKQQVNFKPTTKKKFKIGNDWYNEQQVNNFLILNN